METDYQRAKIKITIVTDGSSGYLNSFLRALWILTAYIIDSERSTKKVFRLPNYEIDRSDCNYISYKITEL